MSFALQIGVSYKGFGRLMRTLLEIQLWNKFSWVKLGIKFQSSGSIVNLN